VVFDSIEDMHARIDDPDLDVTSTRCSFFGAGREGLSGNAEVANLPIPSKLLEQGVRDMVRVLPTGAMSRATGSYRTVVLHVTPKPAGW